MHVALLGPFEVLDDAGRPIALGGARLRALLGRLALDAGRYVPVDTLVDALWGSEPPAGSANALQSLISRLRRALPGCSARIDSGPSGYRLGVERDAVDALAFERLVDSGRAALRAGEVGEAYARLGKAERLWRGTPLVDVGDAAYVDGSVVRLEERRLVAAEDRCEAALALGRAGEVGLELDALAAAHPLRERLQGLAMRALYADGRAAEALQVYERLRGRLAEELGTDPSPELAALHQRVLRQDPSLAGGSSRADGARAAQPGLPVVRPGRPAARHSNLRARLTSFVGRTTELSDVARLLESSRLVTIVGPGGAGKTRLAVESGVRLEPDTPDGTWLVELASVTDPLGVAYAVLSAVGLREAALFEAGALEAGTRDGVPAMRDAMTRLVEEFASRRALLVLDNCEHVVETAADLVHRLLAECPELRILATSREPLDVDGESLYPIPPLGWPSEPIVEPEEALTYPAVRLFVDRAVAVRPDFTLAVAVGPVVEICRRLDGMPLAIELAAARVRAMSPAQIAERLDDRFRLLTGGRRTALPRHRTLRAVVEWSWELLDDTERLLARRLAVFPAGATLEAAERVCAGTGREGDRKAGRDDGAGGAFDVLDVLTGLVDKSFVEVGSPGAANSGAGPRYRMLETVRAYALERLEEAGEVRAIRAAHARHFQWLAHTADPLLRTADQVRWLARLRAEQDNLTAALLWATEAPDADLGIRLVNDLWWFWLLEGNRIESGQWVRAVLAIPGDSPRALRVTAMLYRAIALLGTGQLSEGLRLVARVRLDTRREKLGDAHPILRMVEIGIANLLRGDAAAEARVTAILPTLDDWERATISVTLAAMRENTGDVAGAEEVMRRSLAIFERIGDRWGQSTALRMIAGHRSRAGDASAAVEAFERAGRLVGELGSHEDLGQILAQTGVARARSGDLEGARRDLEKGWAYLRGIDDPESLAFGHLAFAELAARLGELDRARGLLDSALAALDPGDGSTANGAMPAPQLRALVMIGRAGLALLEGDRGVARTLLEQAYPLARVTRDLPVNAEAVRVYAGLALAEGDAERAARLLGLATALRGGPDDLSDLLRTPERAREALGAEGYERAYASTASVPRAEAVALLDQMVGEEPVEQPDRPGTR